MPGVILPPPVAGKRRKKPLPGQGLIIIVCLTVLFFATSCPTKNYRTPHCPVICRFIFWAVTLISGQSGSFVGIWQPNREIRRVDECLEAARADGWTGVSGLEMD